MPTEREMELELDPRYPDRAEMCRILASWVDDEYRALEGGHERQVTLDDRGMFPGTLAP
jgi:hypothetical protein